MRFAAAIALACAPAFAEEPRAAAPDTFARIVEERLAESETRACIAAGIAGEKTQMKFACTAGAGPGQLDEHSIFEIGSITKGFTGLLLADMVRKGEVALDDPVSKYARSGAKLPTRAGRQVILRDLVTQTSGLPRMPPRFSPGDPRNPYADFTEDRLYESLAVTEILGKLNHYEYSNYGFMWLTDLIARRLGKPYDVALKERVLDPLGMGETAIILTPDQAKRFVDGHRASSFPAPHWDFPVNVSGVGGLRSSLSDMLKLAAALAGRADTPLKETIELALEPMRPGGLDSSVAFGWIVSDRGGTRVQWHNGGTAGFRSVIAVSPATRVAAVVLSDSETAFDDLAMHLVDPKLPMKKKRVALPIDAEAMKEYVGRYELTPDFALEIYVDSGSLMAQATQQRAFAILREDRDLFYYTVVPAKLRFARGAGGAVEAVTLEQGGRELKGERAPSTR